jgi:hypothetical protein
MVAISIKQVFKTSYNVLKSNFKDIVAAIAVVISPLVSILVNIVVMNRFGLIQIYPVMKTLLVVIACSAILVTFILMFGYTKNIFSLYNGRSMNCRTLFVDGRSVALPMGKFTICFMAFIFVFSLSLNIIIAAIAFIAKLLPAFATIFFVLIGLIGLIGFCLYIYGLGRLMYAWFDVLENPQHSLKESFMVSWNLTKGKMLKISLFLICSMLITIPLTALLQGGILFITPHVSSTALSVFQSAYGICSVAITLLSMVFVVGMYDALKKSHN